MRTTLALASFLQVIVIVSNAQQQPSTDAAFYRKDVAPLMKARCLSCHSGATPMGGLKLTTRADILKGGASGPAVDLKKPELSLLLKAVNFQGRLMPPSGKIPAKEIATFTKWSFTITSFVGSNPIQPSSGNHASTHAWLCDSSPGRWM